jgi:hypothetical protein
LPPNQAKIVVRPCLFFAVKGLSMIFSGSREAVRRMFCP